MATSPSRADQPRAGAGAPLWAACAAAVFVPWTLAPGLRDAWVLPKCAAAAAAATAGLAAWARAGAPSVALGVERPAAAFLAALGLAAAASSDPFLSWVGPDFEPAAGVLGAAAGVAALYLGAAAARLRADALPVFSRAVVLAAAPMGLLAAFQAVSPASTGWLGWGKLLGRAVGTFGHPVALGAYLAVAAPYALRGALAARGRSALVGWSCALVCVGAGLAAAGGRSAWVGAALGCSLVLWLDGRPWARRATAAALALAAAGALALSARLTAAGQRTGGRLAAWAIAWEAFSERPLAGWGPGTFSPIYRRERGEALAASESPAVSFPHAHNDWLEVLAGAGLLGASAYAWLHVRAAGAAGRVWGPAGAAGLGGALALLAQSKLNLPPVTATFLGAAGLGAALAAAPAPASGRAAAGGLFVATCLMALALSASRLPSERSAHLGRLARAAGAPREAAERFEAAVAGAPGVVAFRLDLMNLLWDLAADAAPEDRDVLLARARDAALEGARLRPAEPEFARLLGLAELKRAEAGAPSLPAARAALEAALAADPFNPRTREALKAAAEREPREGSRRP
jgi:O-antigen ligase